MDEDYGSQADMYRMRSEDGCFHPYSVIGVFLVKSGFGRERMVVLVGMAAKREGEEKRERERVWR